jgi:glycerophosphoryl diester phosphodiesterase
MRQQGLPLVIAHRGASGYLPEHTLAAYELAIDLGADYVEPDLVATRDGHLIARHEPDLTATTDVGERPEFAARRRSAVVDGITREGWFAADFTLEEIRTLRAVQPLAERPRDLDRRLPIPTLEEVIDLVRRKSRETGRVIGIYPEVKHPTYHRGLGLPLEPALVQALRRADWDRRDAPVFIQSFEPSSLRALRGMTAVRLIQLVDASGVSAGGGLELHPPSDRPYDWTVAGDPRRYDFLVSDEGLREVAGYADGIGPWKRYLVSTAGSGEEAGRRLLPPTDLVQRAHRQGLLVHVWTLRNEPRRLAADYAGNPVNEYLQLYRLGVDGVFADFPDTAFAARRVHDLSRAVARD